MLSPRVPDLAGLELLVAVATTGSLGRAAVQRGVSQPAVSAHVRRLEQLVGLPLVRRAHRGSTLTPAGALLVDWGRDVLAAAAVLDAGISSLRGERDGRLQVAASLTVAEHLLPRWLVRLTGDHPGIRVGLAAVNSAEVARLVLAGQAQLGFVEGPDLPAGLAGEVVARDRLVVVVPPDHRWARRRAPLAAAELAATPLVQREQGSGTRTASSAALGGAATPLLELSSTSAVRAAVLAGAGPAVVSNLAVADDLAAGRLVSVRVAGVDLARALRAVWPAGPVPAGPARDLLAIARRG